MPGRLEKVLYKPCLVVDEQVATLDRTKHRYYKRQNPDFQMHRLTTQNQVMVPIQGDQKGKYHSKWARSRSTTVGLTGIPWECE